jgi:DNA-binding transcriptional LysR family regulator
MELQQIRYFLAVCETLNFTRAAEACQVTQPALSRAIQQLEHEVGGPLFRRERNLTHLTDLGLLMRPQLERVMGTLNEVSREVKRHSLAAKPQLVAGIMCTVGPTRFTGLLADFRMRCPDVALRIIEGEPNSLTARLENGEIDVAVMASATGFGASFEVRLLYRERFLIACPPGHRFTDMPAVPMAEVDGENYLLRVNCEYRDAIHDILQRCGCAVNICYRSEREDWIQNMVAGGLGICFIPEYSAILPGIEVRPVVEPELWRDVNLVRLADRPVSQAVEMFTRAVGNYPWPESRF